MFHDDLFKGIDTIYKSYKDMFSSKDDKFAYAGITYKDDEGNELTPDLMRKKYEVYDGEVEHINGITERILSRGEAVFYFDDLASAKDLLSTGLDFYEQGILNPPFDKCMYIVRDKNEPIMVLWIEKEGDAYRLASFCPEKNLIARNPIIGTPFWPEANVLLRRDFMSNAKDTIQGSPDAYNFKVSMLYAPRGQSAADTKESMIQHIALFIQGSMQLALPHYTKDKTEISDKLKKARERSGKPPLSGYTTVRLRKEIKDYLNRGSNGSGLPKKPHWRRGHIRKLKNRNTAVRPCMVNWDGDKNLDKNIYFVKGENKNECVTNESGAGMA